MKYIATIQQKVRIRIDSNSTGLSDKEIVKQLLKENIPFSSMYGGGCGRNNKKPNGYVGYDLETEDKIKIISIKRRKK